MSVTYSRELFVSIVINDIAMNNTFTKFFFHQVTN